ncbi:MAG: DUF192 domain-containing protein [bacterium]|nr:DUF192 domain-containing protein [bacterium]
MKESIFFIILVAVVVVWNFMWVEKKYTPPASLLTIQESKIKYTELAGKKIKVELAQMSETRAQGLSGRVSIPEDEGMLFIFENSAQHLFWMKDMKFALDIIWINEDGVVVYIKKSLTSATYPEVFKPGKNAKYVLEVNAGFSEKNNLKEGDSVNFTF